MNRENKRKTFEKGYYKTHACNDTFTCKVCGRVCTPQNAGRRQSHEAHEHCHEAVVRSAVPAGLS